MFYSVVANRRQPSLYGGVLLERGLLLLLLFFPCFFFAFGYREILRFSCCQRDAGLGLRSRAFVGVFFFVVVYGTNVMSARPIVGGASTSNGNDAPSRKGCVVKGRMAQASNE